MKSYNLILLVYINIFKSTVKKQIALRDRRNQSSFIEFKLIFIKNKITL